MGFLAKLALTTAVLAVLLGWFLYTPIPAGYSKPWAVHTSISSFKLAITLGAIGRGLGWTDYGIRRAILDRAGQAKVRDHEDIEIIDMKFDDVPVRIYVPRGKLTKSPGFVYYHGGGWVIGSVLSSDPMVLDLARGLNMVVVSVDYRLAPEHVFPAAFDDCVMATKFFLKNAADFGVDATRVGIGGDSAGGHMAAAVSLKLRNDKFEIRNKLQVLMYPVTQAVDFQSPSYQANVDDPILSVMEMTSFWSNYLFGNTKKSDALAKNKHTSSDFKKQIASTYMDVSKLPKELIHDGYVQPKTDYGDEKLFKELKDILLNPYVSPLLANDLSGLPKAYVFTCQHDVLRDEGIWYAQRLKEAGVDVTHRHAEIGFHAILRFSDIPEAVDFLQEIISYIKANL